MFDIVFLSYNEPNADENWNLLKSRFPYARRLHGVKGIHRAHQVAAQMLGLPDKIWFVDGDNIIADDFDFTPPLDLWEDAVYVYRSKNAVNDLVYGYGGIKLFPKLKTANMPTDGVDMTTSISENFIPIDNVASITKFNTDPYNAWRSGFRECVKLSSRIIDRQINHETEERLNTWCTVGSERPYGEYAIAGAQQGKEYGLSARGDKEKIKLINDNSWLKKKFDEQYS
jgi:hypothetical protein